MNTIERPDVASVLSQMRSMREAAQGELLQTMREPDRTDGPDPTGSNFGSMLKTAVGEVNELSLESTRLSDAFVRGETDDLVGVMVAMQKSTVAFQAATQVRNRMVSAYQDIMNMPI